MIRFLRQADVGNRRVILRADFNVAVKNGRIFDDDRIREVLPSIRFILKKRGKLRVIAHLGRPGGRRVSSLSLKPVAGRLAKLLGRKIVFVGNCLSESSFAKYGDFSGILFFENVRFFRGEEKNDFSFARKLARWGDLYVNDAFADSHRKHASIVSLPRLLPSFAGFCLEKEIKSFGRFFSLIRGNHPLLVVGGKKSETKLPLIKSFLQTGAEALVGGELANSILALKKISVGRSAVEKKSAVFSAYYPNLRLPADFAVAASLSSKWRVAGIGGVKKSENIFDIGPETAKMFGDIIGRAEKTIVWNGTMGVAELPKFSKGTEAVAKAMSRNKTAFKIAGGGDTAAFLRKRGFTRGFNHISTGGGAMLEFLLKKSLPGLEALKKRK